MVYPRSQDRDFQCSIHLYTFLATKEERIVLPTENRIPRNLPKHGMFISQFIRLIKGDEELRSVGVPLPAVCHSH